MGRIWNGIKTVGKIIRKYALLVSEFIAHPVVGSMLEKLGRVGKGIAGVGHLAGRILDFHDLGQHAADPNTFYNKNMKPDLFGR
jgi:hypothetical protein